MNKIPQKSFPLVSVLVPVYGVEKYIERCAHSLFKQTLSDIEYIFVDDCSKDKSIEILESVCQEYPHRAIKIIRHSKNLGLAGARLTGFKNANGKYWICCDSDDWVEPDMYERMVEVAENNDADIVCCEALMESKDVVSTMQYQFTQDSYEKIFNTKYYGDIYGAIWNKLIRADLYKNYHIEPWVGINMWEDSCLTIRLRCFSRKTIILKDCLYHYNVSNTNSITSTFNINKVKEMILAVKNIELFLASSNIPPLEKGNEWINYLKLHSKEVLLRFPTKTNVEMFRSTFPETNKYLFSYPNWNLILKIRAWLVAVLPLRFALLVLRIVRK